MPRPLAGRRERGCLLGDPQGVEGQGRLAGRSRQIPIAPILPGGLAGYPSLRSRRGEAPEGSSFFSPHVEARSAEDCGESGSRERYTTPPGRRTYRSDNECDALAGSRGHLRYLIHGSSGLRPSTRGYEASTPRGASSHNLHDEMNSFCTALMRHLWIEHRGLRFRYYSRRWMDRRKALTTGVPHPPLSPVRYTAPKLLL